MAGVYDRDNQWGVGLDLGQKEHYYNYYVHFKELVEPVLATVT